MAKPTNAPDVQHPYGPETEIDPASLGTHSQAWPSLKRELLQMSELIETMFRPVMALYQSGGDT
jgi:phosphate:Na+ symporter